MFKSSLQTIEQFKEVLLLLPEEFYTKKCSTLSGATIGQHTRHIIELYQCLLQGYEIEEVNYDNRKRDKLIELDINIAIHQLEIIQSTLEQDDKKLFVTYELNNSEVRIESNYLREVMYNLEHTIHHQALIKVAINQFVFINLPVSFGVAPSTMDYRNKSVI